MIAKVAYLDDDGNPAEATLGDDQVWSVPGDAMLARILNGKLASEDRSPARGNWLLWHARSVAEILDGEITVEPKRPAPKDAPK